MMNNISREFIFNTIIVILFANFILELILYYLNAKSWSKKLPDEVKDIYNEEKYVQARAYEKDKQRISMIISVFSFVSIMLLLILGGFKWLHIFVTSFFNDPVLQSLSFFAIIAFASDILTLPFSYYSIFVIEQKYGFNKMTKKTFVLDKIKSWILIVILGGGLGYLIIWLYLNFQDRFWIFAWIIMTVVMILLNMFYSTLIVPLFNKQTPLEDGALKDALYQLAEKTKFKLKQIFVIDGSKRSSKANAYFAGIGPKKRIVLFDTLINKHTTQELVAVLAHEVGHFKMKHVIINMILAILQTGIMFFIIGKFVGSPMLSASLGVPDASFHIGILVFGILFSPISLIIGIIENYFSRKFEYQADAYAAKYANAEDLAVALKKLSADNLKNLTPHRLDVFLHYSHPPLLDRLKHLSKFKN